MNRIKKAALSLFIAGLVMATGHKAYANPVAVGPEPIVFKEMQIGPIFYVWIAVVVIIVALIVWRIIKKKKKK